MYSPNPVMRVKSVKKGQDKQVFKSGKIQTFSAKTPFELVSIDICNNDHYHKQQMDIDTLYQ